MGCCATKRSVPLVIPKVELPHQEKTIAQGEKLIPFSSKSSRDLEQAFKANGSNGKMSVPQLKKTLGILELDPSVFTNPDTQIFKFLQRLKGGDKLYDIQKLSLCAILLGDGDVNTKATILFQHFDIDASEKLERQELITMLDEMVDISVRKIPILSLKNDDEEANSEYPKLTEQEIDDYGKTLEVGKAKFVETVLSKLLGGSDGISLGEFVTKVTADEYLQRLVWSANIRVTLYEEAKRPI